MCGLFGLIHKKEFTINENDFLENLELINRRGPDYTGYYTFSDEKYNFKFGHKRLSILDLTSAGNQPFKTESGSILIYNGEIYNHYSVRRVIEKKLKIQWKSTSDTETLIHLLENFTIDFALENLEGMFSFLYYNKKKQKLIVSRDLAGEKPMYLHFNKNIISFSSNLLTISKLNNIEKKIDDVSVSSYKKYSYIPYPNTIYKNFFKLPPASYMEINLNDFNLKDFSNFADLIASKGITFREWWKPTKNLDNNLLIKNFSFEKQKFILEKTLTSSIDKQLISDAPLGAFLSGGIDSSLIVSIASKLKKKLNTFTIGFDFNTHDESIYAEKIAKKLNTNHEKFICNKLNTIDTIKDLQKVYDEPFADSSQIPTILVSQIASSKVKVSLSGDGGDELFGGYNRYLFANKYWYILSKLPVSMRSVLISVLNNLPHHLKIFILNFFIKNVSSSTSKTTKFIEKIRNIHNKYEFYDSLVSVWEDENKKSINNYKHFYSSNYKNNKIEDLMMISDFKSYLTDDILCKVDRATMYNSLESRAPFLDKNVIELGFALDVKAKINKGRSKFILKEILSNYLPEKYYIRPKMGFAIPLNNWFKHELKDFMMDTLSKQNIIKSNFFDFNIVKTTIDDHLSNKFDNTNKIWNIIQLINWYEANS